MLHNILLKYQIPKCAKQSLLSPSAFTVASLGCVPSYAGRCCIVKEKKLFHSVVRLIQCSQLVVSCVIKFWITNFLYLLFIFYFLLPSVVCSGCLSTSSYWAVGLCCWWKLFWQGPSPSARCFSSSPLSTVTRKTNHQSALKQRLTPDQVKVTINQNKTPGTVCVSQFHKRQLQVLLIRLVWSRKLTTSSPVFPVVSLNELVSFFISRKMCHQETSAYGWLM